MFKKILFFIFSVKRMQSSKGFSIIGVLVAISMGILVTLALSSMLSSMNSDVTEIKKTANQIELANQINTLLATDCQASLLNSLDSTKLNELKAGGVGAGKDPITFPILKDGGDFTILDTNTSNANTNNKQKIKRLYGIEGHSRFQLICKSVTDTDNPDNRCDCSTGTYPCNSDWLLSLFTMSYNKGYKDILKQNLRISYKDSDPKKFTCNFTASIEKTSNNTRFGYKTDESNTTGSFNSFFGSKAGQKNTTGIKNSFFGSDTGRENTIGKHNSFFGVVSGENHRESVNNSFFGYETVRKLNSDITIKGNSIFGAKAVFDNEKIANQNSLFGWAQVFEVTKSAVEQEVHRHTVFGYPGCYDGDLDNLNHDSRTTLKVSDSGKNILCISRTIIGKGAATDNNKYPSAGIDIHGKLRVCPPSQSFSCSEVEIEQESGTSSRKYKKNIVPFNNINKALEALVKTPLFTYQYKTDYPEKKRMGIISEELPKALQLPVKAGEPIYPDWISIYGYLWAGIKALNKEILDSNDNVFKDLQSLESLFQKEWKFIKNIVKDLKKLKIKIKKLKKKIEIFEKENPLKIEIQESKQEEIEKEIKQLKTQAILFQEELKEIKKQNKD